MLLSLLELPPGFLVICLLLLLAIDRFLRLLCWPLAKHIDFRVHMGEPITEEIEFWLCWHFPNYQDVAAELLQ